MSTVLRTQRRASAAGRECFNGICKLKRCTTTMSVHIGSDAGDSFSYGGGMVSVILIIV